MLDLQPLDRVLPFAILLLPLAGFVVLALFGDWIKKDGEEQGAAWLACGTVLVAFGLAVWTTVRLYGYVAGPEGLRFAQADATAGRRSRRPRSAARSTGSPSGASRSRSACWSTRSRA